MGIAFIKYKNDNKSLKFFEIMGANVRELEDIENTDNEIRNLIKEDYRTIILTNEVAGFSESIIKRYNKNKDIKIIIV